MSTAKMRINSISHLFILLSLVFILPLIFTLAAAAAQEEETDIFADVPRSHWAYTFVENLVDAGLIEDNPDGLFKGDEPFTRYEMAVILSRVLSKLGTYDQTLKALEESKENLKEYITVTISDAFSSSSDIMKGNADLSAELTSLVLEFSKELRIIKSEVDSLTNRINIMENQVEVVREEVKAINQKVGNVIEASRIESLEQEVAELNKKISDQEMKITRLYMLSVLLALTVLLFR